ncbi:DNA (cytosine-5-)-methyltransferase, partial [Patescibacteria group bacterium]|nr:DNA (cytosine-5-)-methyltransferase [Patescibacteria group bacterium]
MKFIDLFAGIGGFHLGLHCAGGECVFVSEWDGKARITYEENFKTFSPDIFKSGMFSNEVNLFEGDITKVNEKDIPGFDILCAGFPCQPFSIAGYRKGFSDDGRGNLFFEIVRILKYKKPAVFLLENVKNLKTHDNGRTIEIIYSELQSLGYHVADRVLNTMEYGNIPQNRERIYIVGFLDQGLFNNFSFPDKIPLTKRICDCLEKNVDEKYYYNGKSLFSKLKKEVIKQNTIYQWRRQYVRENKNKVCPTLT